MYKNIERLQQTKGLKHFNFLPKTFILPAEFAEFSAAFNKLRGGELFIPFHYQLKIDNPHFGGAKEKSGSAGK